MDSENGGAAEEPEPEPDGSLSSSSTASYSHQNKGDAMPSTTAKSVQGWRAALLLVPMALVAGLTVFLRWYDTAHGLHMSVNVQPSPERLVVPKPAFCETLTPGMENNIFYFGKFE